MRKKAEFDANLFLLEVNGHFESLQLHVVAVLVWRALWIVVKNDCEFLRGTCLVEQIDRKLLTLTTQLQVFRLTFLLGKRQISQFPREL